MPKLRTRAMINAAKSDIELIANALTMYHEDLGAYPEAPYSSFQTSYEPNPIDGVLYRALVDRNAGGNSRGWGGAKPSGWDFIRSGNVREYHYPVEPPGPISKQILDPWGTPYYYIPHTNYLTGVLVYDPGDSTYDNPGNFAQAYGTMATDAPYRTDYPDFDSSETPAGPSPVPALSNFYNTTTFQIHSKGPDRLTDAEDGHSSTINACDRGLDSDDINNWTVKK